MLKNDYLLTQIEGLARAIAKIFFNKEKVVYEVAEEETLTDELYRKLREMIDQGEINEAENILYDHMISSDLRYLELVLDFYNRLNELDEAFLEAHDYGKDEILQGLKDVASCYGVPLN